MYCCELGAFTKEVVHTVSPENSKNSTVVKVSEFFIPKYSSIIAHPANTYENIRNRIRVTLFDFFIFNHLIFQT